MDQITRLVAIALGFGVTVFVHEAGHFIAARLAGMAVHEFSIGIGRPLLFWFRRGETQYSFRLWPFFSFVRVAGMEPGDDHPRGFHTKSRLAQAFVLATGCIMNFMLAVMIFILIGAVLGRPVEVTKTIDRVLPKTPAEQAGLMVGDTLLGINARTDLPLDQIVDTIRGHPEQPLTLEIERAGQRLSLTITPRKVIDWGPEGEKTVPIGRIGVVFRPRIERMGVGESVVAGFHDTSLMIYMLVVHLVDVLRTGRTPALVGPVGVVQIMYEEAQVDWRSFLLTFAAVTVSIGFLNLLPVPPLDGSRLVIVGLEALRGKPFDKRKEIIVHLVGFALLIALVVVLTYKDILRIIIVGGG